MKWFDFLAKPDCVFLLITDLMALAMTIIFVVKNLVDCSCLGICVFSSETEYNSR